MKTTTAIALLFSCPTLVAAQQVATLSSGTTALLQAVSAPGNDVVWVSGHAGTILRSLDGGATWEKLPIAGTERLQFRDIHAASADMAWVLSAGNGPQSTIHFTSDGGRNWTRQFVNADSAAFYDCLAFFDSRTGVAISDASQGRTNILRTTDGGATWELLPPTAVPAPLDGEGAFAASGGCAVSRGPDHGWLAMGTPAARIFRTTDRGATWAAHPTPFVAGSSAGLTALSFRDTMNGIGVAGRIGSSQLMSSDTAAAAVGITRDGGVTWTLRSRPVQPGALFGVTHVDGAGDGTAVAVSPGGLSVTRDDGGSWTTVDTAAYWSAGAYGRTAWAVGPGGRIVKLEF